MKKLLITILACLICLQGLMPCFAFEELSKGSKGDAVIELQNRLNELGYNVGKADGDSGGKTEKAIIQYQEDNGLEMTGTLNSDTYNALFNSSAAMDTDTEEALESTSIVSQALLSNEDIVDIYYVGYGMVSFLTNKGECWEVSFDRDGNFSEELVAKNVKSILGKNATLFVYEDGNVEWSYDGYPFSLNDEWHDLIAADTYNDFAVGLRNDNTWVTVGEYSDGQRDVDEWTDIIDVQTGNKHVVGLKADGTVVATGNNKYGQCNVSNWTDIVQIAVNANDTIGLKSDGTIVATGQFTPDTPEIFEWENVVFIDTYVGFTIGITNDGTLLLNDDAKRAIKYNENARHIPSDFKFNNVWKVFISGVSSDLSIALVSRDCTIEIFGDNIGNRLGKMMDYINQGRLSTESTNDFNSRTEDIAKATSNEQFEYDYSTEEFAELISKGINGTLTQEEAELLDLYYIHYK